MRAAASDSVIDPERLLALFAAKDLEAFIDSAFHMLRAAVPCDFASAFYRSAGNGLVKERDSQGRESGSAFMRRYVELTPALPLAMANPGIKILTTQRTLPRSAEALRQSPFYREIMQPQGWRHAVALCFWGDPPAASPIFVASVNRAEGQTDFSKREIAVLESLHPFLDRAVNRLHEHEAAKTVGDGMAIAVRGGTRGVAILDSNLCLVQANPVARQLCAAWGDDAGAMRADGSSLQWRLPSVLAAACRELHHEWQCLLRGDPDATGLRRCQLMHPRAGGLTASITMVCPNTGLGEPTFLIEFNRPAPALQKMTPAERAVATVLAGGLSNQEIADQLGKTVDAVKFVLHRIYQKTGIPNRTALVAVLRSRPSRSPKGRRT